MGFSSSASLRATNGRLAARFPWRKLRKGRWSDIEPASRGIHCYSILDGHYLGADRIGKLRECFPTRNRRPLARMGASAEFEVNLHHSDPAKMADTSVTLEAGDEADCVSSRVHGDVHGKVSRRFVGMFGPHPHELSKRPSPRSPDFSTRISRSVSATRSRSSWPATSTYSRPR